MRALRVVGMLAHVTCGAAARFPTLLPLGTPVAGPVVVSHPLWCGNAHDAWEEWEVDIVRRNARYLDAIRRADVRAAAEIRDFLRAHVPPTVHPPEDVFG